MPQDASIGHNAQDLDHRWPEDIWRTYTPEMRAVVNDVRKSMLRAEEQREPNGRLKAHLERLKNLGVRLSVDDFGTGYFSLRHLRELPIDRIKIDRSFVTDLPEGRSAEAIARAIIQMAHSLGLAVVAEGVETQAQFEILASLGCNELQGRWTGSPMP